MRICVLGHTGFVGSAVFSKLKALGHVVHGINSSSSPPLVNDFFDVLVNCDGCSSKHGVEVDFVGSYKTECAILDRVLSLNYARMIHISSIDADMRSPSIYGLLKRLIELDMQIFRKSLVILRLAGLVGPGLKKNVVFDIVNKKPLYLTADSMGNFIDTTAVAEVVSVLIGNRIFDDDIVNVAANDSISVREICEMFDHNVAFGDRKESYSIDTTKLEKIYAPKSSKFYLNRYRDSL
jgi:nucleoside-diphosphate-sugar epimerase